MATAEHARRYHSALVASRAGEVKCAVRAELHGLLVSESNSETASRNLIAAATSAVMRRDNIRPDILMKMRNEGRYEAHGVEVEFEPGSRQRVLRNLNGIRSVREMARMESEALLAATERMIDEATVEQRFTAVDVRRMHRLWLGSIYPWAGEYRHINMEKDGFPFAAANHVPRLMQELERGALRKFTPCRFESVDDQAHAIGFVHAELILIHPFREGNGRCARLLATLMGLQAQLPALDFGGIRGDGKRRYVAAIQAAMARDYAPIAAVFRVVIERTLWSQARPSGG